MLSIGRTQLEGMVADAIFTVKSPVAQRHIQSGFQGANARYPAQTRNHFIISALYLILELMISLALKLCDHFIYHIIIMLLGMCQNNFKRSFKYFKSSTLKRF